MSDITQAPLADVPEAQSYLGGISRTQLYELRSAGLIQFVKIGRRAFVTRTSLDQYVERISAAAQTEVA